MSIQTIIDALLLIVTVTYFYIVSITYTRKKLPELLCLVAPFGLLVGSTLTLIKYII